MFDKSAQVTAATRCKHSCHYDQPTLSSTNARNRCSQQEAQLSQRNRAMLIHYLECENGTLSLLLISLYTLPILNVLLCPMLTLKAGRQTVTVTTNLQSISNINDEVYLPPGQSQQVLQTGEQKDDIQIDTRPNIT